MRNGGIQVRVSDMIFALQKRWKLIFALTTLGILFGLLLSGMSFVQSSYRTYGIKGSVAVTSINSTGIYTNGYTYPGGNDFHLSEDMVDAVHYVLTSDRLINMIINDTQFLGLTVADIRDNLSIRQYNSTQVIEISLTWRSAEEGVTIWYALVAAANELLPQTLQLGSLAVINEPAAETGTIVSSGASTLALLAMLGFALGIGFALMELLMHPTLNNIKDVEPLFGLETLGVIPKEPGRSRGKISLTADEKTSSSEAVQNYASTAYILRNRLGRKEKHQCFFVTSASAREGKSSVAANLAVQLSLMEYHTLLIDFDTRNPSLGTIFLDEVDYGSSLNALYRGEAIEQDVIITLTGYLDLLPTVLEHNTIPLDGTIEELILRLKEQYDYVIIDSAPVGLVSDALSLNQVTNNALFVIGYDTATIPEIQSAVEKLDKSGVRVFGCVVNGVKTAGSGFDQAQYGMKRAGQKKKDRKKKQSKEESFVPAQKKEAPVDVPTVNAEKPAEPANAKADAKPAPAAEKPAEPQKPRNVMDDLVSAYISASESGSDQDAIAALLKMGLDGSWEDKNSKDQ